MISPELYEAARARYNAADAALPAAVAEAERLVREASDEWDAAQAALRELESYPGIPLPECRMAS
jgi:hypothetical protein